MSQAVATAPVITTPPRPRHPSWLWLVGPVLYGAGLGVVAIIWWRLSGRSLAGANTATTLIVTGRLLGLAAFYQALWQLLLIGRMGWLEPVYGHDQLSRWHHTNGLVTVVLVLMHPAFIIGGYALQSHVGLVTQYLNLLTIFEDVLNATWAYLLFASIVAISLTIIRRRLRYEWWYAIHLLLYVAIILSFGHQHKGGLDLTRGWPEVVWWGLLLATFGAIGWYRFARPALAYGRYRFRVTAVVAEAGGATSVVIEGRGLERLAAAAGQFVMVRFWARGYWWESHPFSLSEMPRGHRLRITAKALGDFTNRLPQLPLGTPVVVDGPYGRLTTDIITRPKTLLIAGGIGITPLRAVFEELAAAGRTVDLIYAARTETDFALAAELNRLSTPTARIHYRPEAAAGRLTAAALKQVAPDVATRDILLCGPPPMMKAVAAQLLSLGVPRHQIHTERFRLG